MYTRVSKLLFRSTEDVPSNENVLAFVKMYLSRLDDALEKMKHSYDDELNIINGVVKKYGVDKQKWRRDVLAEVERFVEKHGGEGDGSIPGVWVAFNRNHTWMLRDEEDSIASSSGVFEECLDRLAESHREGRSDGRAGEFLFKVLQRFVESHRATLRQGT